MEKLLSVLSSSAVGNVAMLSSSAFAFIAILVTIITAKKQAKEAEKERTQQKEQYKESLDFQKEQYEKQLEHNRLVEEAQEKPCLVFVGISNFQKESATKYTLNLKFKNKGNGSAFYISPDTDITDYGGKKDINMYRVQYVQDHVAMVGESFETQWEVETKSGELDFQGVVTIKYEDASARLYRQKFYFVLQTTGHLDVTKYSIPVLERR